MPTFLPTALIMPATAVGALLPNPTLSILQFLEFPLPPNPVTLLKLHLLPSDYFSSEQPNVEDLRVIKTIPLPPADVVSTLLPYIATLVQHTETTDSKLSVLCAHTDGIATAQCLPLWTITYWTKALHLKNTIQQPWIDAERVLQHRIQFKKGISSPGNHHLVEQTYVMLGLLPWSGFVLGFENHEKITHLMAYMTQEWLSDVHEAQMLELLRNAIHQQKGTTEVEIQGPYFYSYLKSAAEAGEFRYRNTTSFTQARSLGEALQSGQRTSVGFITHVHQNHWVAAVIDFSEQCILYGDSLGGRPDIEFITVIQWWIQYHAGTQFAI